MARVRTMAGSASISGRMGNYCFRTMRGSRKVFMYQVPSKSEKLKVKKERNVTDAVKAQRERFGTIAKMVVQLHKSGSKKTNKQLWKIAQEAYDAANQ